MPKTVVYIVNAPEGWPKHCTQKRAGMKVRAGLAEVVEWHASKPLIRRIKYALPVDELAKVMAERLHWMEWELRRAARQEQSVEERIAASRYGKVSWSGRKWARKPPWFDAPPIAPGVMCS